MARTALFASLMLLGACAGAPKPAATGVDYSVVVARGADGSWTAEYAFDRAAPAWAFPRSGVTVEGQTPWRPRAWTIETPGVRLERHGAYDVLTAGGAPLRSVRARFTPFTEELYADYRPTLRYTDGGLAHYTNQFELVPLGGAAEADALGPDVDSATIPTSSRLTFRDPGRRILFKGVVTEGSAVTSATVGSYAYFGDTPMIETPAMAGVIDPGIPAWIRAELNDFVPKLLALHTERLGKPAGGRPMVLAAWGGGEIEGASLNGGVSAGLLQMDMRGKVALEPGKPMRNVMLWFLGHETSHFWLSAEDLRLTDTDDNWMLEGGADVLAVRALGTLAPEYDPRPKLQSAVDDCLKLIAPNEPLVGAVGRGEHRAQYACGAVLLLAAEAGLKRREPQADAYVFWRRLIEANRTDETLTSEDWLAAFRAATGDAALTAEVDRFVNQGVDDPAAFVARLFKETGVAVEMSPEGKLKLA